MGTGFGRVAPPVPGSFNLARGPALHQCLKMKYGHKLWKKKPDENPFARDFNGSHGGSLRKARLGRGKRPLSTKHPIHVVLKIDRRRLRARSLKTYANYRIVSNVLHRYANYFRVRIEQYAVEGDHIHLLIRTPRRSQSIFFFRVVAGQIAQRAATIKVAQTGVLRQRGTKLWKHRPFTKVVRGRRYYRNVRNYIRLNLKESLGVIPYRKERLRGLSLGEWEILWR